MEALSLSNTLFPFQSKTNTRNTHGNTLVLALAQEEYVYVPNERDIIKGI